MPESDLLLSLSAPEVRLLTALRKAGKGLPEADLTAALSLSPETVRGSLERMKSKRLVVSEDAHLKGLSLTPRGKEAEREGLPERRLLSLLSKGPLSQEEALAAGAFDRKEFAVAVGQLKRLGAVEIKERMRAVPDREGALKADEDLLRSVQGGIVPGPERKEDVERLVRRGLLSPESRTLRSWSLSPEGARLELSADPTASLGALTQEHLRSRSWQGARFRPYDVRVPAPYLGGARSHAYLSFLREFEDILIGLGFEEGRGTLTELDFYNNDALFIPQSHPARRMLDMFFLKDVEGRYPPEELLARVGHVHEGQPVVEGEAPLSAGWGERYRRELSRRTLLRAHLTPISVRYLLNHPEPPFRMYSIGPAFRREAVDSTHHVQFDQCEGVYGGKDVSLRNLLGLFTAVAKAIGIDEVRFKPTYFPFTEPSVEGYVKHPSLGWIEVLPGGLFRPEVLRPLGIDVPVAAWGIGVMRLAMVALGIGDIREVYANPIGELSERRI